MTNRSGALPFLAPFIVFGMLCCGQAAADTYFVKPSGDDQAAGGSAPAAFRTLQRAAQVLRHGDRLIVAPGLYRETALFADLAAADGSSVTVTGDEEGTLTGSAAGPIVIGASGGTEPALHFYRCRNLRISGLTFRGPGQGLKVEKCEGATVERCTFDGQSRGLVVVGSTGVRVQSSVVARCILGVVVQASVRTRLAHVTVAGCSSAGVLLLADGAGEIANCVFAANNSNYIADAISSAAWTSDHNVIDGTTGPWGDVPAVAKVYEWNSASGQDRHSVHVVPAFADPEKYDLHVAAPVRWGGGLPGQNVGVPLDPAVDTDRDDKPFRKRGGVICVGAYDYPDPRPAPGWVKLRATLPAGVRQSAGVFRPGGNLVRTLLADATGTGELWWDGLDDQGRSVAAGQYEVRALGHDVHVRDDGNFGDNGNPLGAYNCDNPNRLVGLPDGGFLITTSYDEAGFPIRRYAASGQPVFASNHAEKDYHALAAAGSSGDFYAVIGSGPGAHLVRLVLPGERARMPSGAEAYPLVAAAEKAASVTGLAVVAQEAFVALAGVNAIRVIDLARGTKRADLPVVGLADIAAEGQTVWAISGKDVVALTTAGAVVKRFPTGLDRPRYLAVNKDRIAAVDPGAGRVALLDHAGKPIRTLGKTRGPDQWVKVGAELFRDLRGCAFLSDGRLALTESGRIRILWPETGRLSQDIVSTFVDTAVVHPTRPEYVYTSLGCYHVDPKTGAWQWVLEKPRDRTIKGDKGQPVTFSYGTPTAAVMLGGKPFVGYTPNGGTLFLFEVSDPLQPRLAQTLTGLPSIYHTFAFAKGGDLLQATGEPLRFRLARFTGLDAQGRPSYDLSGAGTVGPEKDPVAARGMQHKGAVAADPADGGIYYLAVTASNNKMVPGWGADGTGVGKSRADGTPLWFAPSSGGNYMAIDTVQAAGKSWVLAAKSFGGQIDLFDPDGLRLTTGAWSWPCDWQFGFVDVRQGMRAYLRPDGKIGAYLEDDSVGRLGRARVDGLETVKKTILPFDWQPAGAPAGPPPDSHAVPGKGVEKVQVIPRVPSLPVDGDWAAWAKAGVVPQMVALPSPNYKRFLPEDVFTTFREGTAVGALAHDGQNFYVYFVVADDSLHFDAEKPNQLFMFDGIELWIEEEQFAMSFLKDGTPSLFKYRHHSLDHKPFAANYELPKANVWAAKLTDLAAHPLGRQLGDTVGVSYRNRTGYAIMAKIPFAEVKLVGGIAGRTGDKILDMTGRPGEVVRVGVNVSGIVAWGREQDFKVGWPASIMFADPTRANVCVLGK